MNKISVIGIVGESVFLSMDSLPKAGETMHAKEMFCELGGKGFNQAVAIARFGGNASFLTAVGTDGYKAKVQAFCEKENIQPCIVEKDGRTAYAVIQTETRGENFVAVYAGATLTEVDIDGFEDEIKTSEYLLITNEVPEPALYRAIELADKYGVKVVYNPAPYRKVEVRIKEKIYLFTPNEHEYKGLENFSNVIITQGKRGCYIKSLDITIPSTADKAVDTTGAGDTFNGVLVAMLSHGAELKKAVETANKASGKSVTKKGAVSSIPYPNEL